MLRRKICLLTTMSLTSTSKMNIAYNMHVVKKLMFG